MAIPLRRSLCRSSSLVDSIRTSWQKKQTTFLVSSAQQLVKEIPFGTGKGNILIFSLARSRERSTL